jgi:hypothetical protein
VALVRERTIPTERPLLVGEVSAKFADAAWSARRIPYGRNIGFLDSAELILGFFMFSFFPFVDLVIGMRH